MASPYQVVLTSNDREVLEGWVRAGNTPQRTVLRALIVLMAADGDSNAHIAAELGVCVDTARKWRARFYDRGIEGLTDAPRSGRPPRYSPSQVAAVTAWACQLPTEHELPLSRWSSPELARQLLIDRISASVTTVRRWRAQDAPQTLAVPIVDLHPGPAVRAEGAVVLDLYARRYDGFELAADEYVISADEKPSIQARRRCHPTQPAGTGRPMRVNHDYRRGGALAYLAAYDVHHARVFGRCETTTGIAPFTALVDRVMSQQPNASAARVFWIVYNVLASWAGRDRSAGRAVPERGDGPYPKHASWLNQVEIYFSIIQRKVLSPNDFKDLDAVERRLLAFEERVTQRKTASRSSAASFQGLCLRRMPGRRRLDGFRWI